MKKSLEILGLPVISITEGRELGMSKTLLIDAKNKSVAAITIEDEDWYRGVKLLPYSSVIAIGNDAVTVTGSDKILTLEDAGDYESMLDANIKIIGTKAITMSGTIQGKVSEIFIGDNGNIEKCEIEAADGSLSEISTDQVSIFGKQVTVIEPDGEKKTEYLAQIAGQSKPVPAEPVAEAAPETVVVPEPETVPEEVSVSEPETVAEAEPEPEVVEEVVPEVVAEPVEAEVVVETTPEPAANEPEPEPVAEEVIPEPEAAPVEPEPVTQQDEPAPEKSSKPDKSSRDSANDMRHRRFLLGKTATRQITTESGRVIVEAGGIVTEEVLQIAKMSNKFIELSMNVQ